jgi:phosphate acetyltransferase
MQCMNVPDELIENLTFDELQVGQRAAERHGVGSHPLASAAWTAEGAPVAVPVALLLQLVSSRFPGSGTVCLEQALQFGAPVMDHDTLTVAVQVVDKASADHRVRLRCEVHNQRDERVVSGDLVVRAPIAKTVRARSATPTLHVFDPQARTEAWLATLARQAPVRCAVVHPCDERALRSAIEAAQRGLIEPVLVGPAARLDALAATLGLALEGLERVDTPHSHASAEAAAALAGRGAVQMLMKGSLHTDELMHAVLQCAPLRTERRMSHVFRFEVPAYPKPLLVTDAAVNIAPDLTAKADIVRNAIDLARALGIERPRVALLSALETVTPDIASTLDAAALCKMADRGQIRGALLDGPLAFDNAVSAEAAHLKGIDSPVAGAADVLVVPDLEAGNMLAKQLEYLAGAASCGVVLGARVPIALTSRADPVVARVASAALAGVAARCPA